MQWEGKLPLSKRASENPQQMKAESMATSGLTLTLGTHALLLIHP